MQLTFDRLFFRVLAAAFLFATSVQAQKGDKGGEVQALLVPAEKIPPSPLLNAEQSLKAFRLQPGFKIELVAIEPLVNEPVSIQFDPDGRLWVLEMQGFMPNADGIGEEKPVGTISLLEDIDGDGKMDKRTEVITNLVMPRSFLLLNDGVLVAEPPNLWFYPLKDGKAGARVLLTNDYAREADPKLGARANPEHAANSLTWAMDNWIYSANYTWRLRRVNGEWKREPTAFRGQWGFSQDDSGRLVYNSNSDQFRIDLVPSYYLRRNANYPAPLGLNVDPIKNQYTFPARVTPGVNRGYQQGTLRPDGTLEKVTAACGPVIYRGDNFPPEYRGNAFVCEPSANLVKRDILVENDGLVTGRQAYTNAEFLASVDEWFRPVNAANGPDGALYLVDMHHGIVQHRYFLTSYLRKQAESRQMAISPKHQGRIYRVVYEGAKPGGKPQLATASLDALVTALSHPNGWWRDTAQQQLVQRAEPASVPLLEKLATAGPNPSGQLQALWTLDGMGRLELAVLKKCLTSANPKIKAAAIRLMEPFFKTEDKDETLTAIAAQVSDSRFEVQWQLGFTLGEVADAKAEQGMLALARQSGSNPYIRDALLTGMGRRELEFLEKILGEKPASAAPRVDSGFLGALAKCVFVEAQPGRVNRLFELIASAPENLKLAMLDGVIATSPAPRKGRTAPTIKPIRFDVEPAGFLTLLKSRDAQIAGRLKKLDGLITWPGQPGYVPPPVVRPLTADEQNRFKAGLELYAQSCVACHQPTGLGQEGLAPPLVGSEWVLGPEQRLVRIALNGVHGPINVSGRKYEMEMPGLAIFEDAQIAALLTYVRREWGHGANPVDEETVKKIRDATATREEAWTEAELLQIK